MTKRLSLMFMAILLGTAMFVSCGGNEDTPEEPGGRGDCPPPPPSPLYCTDGSPIGIPPTVEEKEVKLKADEYWLRGDTHDFVTDYYYGFNISHVYMRDAYSPDNSSWMEPIGDGWFKEVWPNDIDAVPVQVDEDTWVCEEMDLHMHREVRDGEVYLKISVPRAIGKVMRPQIYKVFMEPPYKHCDDPKCQYCVSASTFFTVWKISAGEWARMTDDQKQGYL